MNLSLLVAGLVVAEVGVLLQSLTDAGDVAMPKNTETAGKERLLYAVALHILVFQERNQCLGGGQAAGCRDVHKKAP